MNLKCEHLCHLSFDKLQIINKLHDILIYKFGNESW